MSYTSHTWQGGHRRGRWGSRDPSVTICAGKSLTPRVHKAVQHAFEARFGPFCGWAHNVLFVSEIPAFRQRLPEHLRPPPTPKKEKKARRKGTAEESGGKKRRGGEEDEAIILDAAPLRDGVPHE